MPACPLSFRPRCGGFLWIFIHFMHRRAMDRVQVRTLRIRTRAAGVTVGLLLAQIFFCNLLAQCGDVEPNPGPPKLDQSTLRQTRLTSRGDSDGASRRESVGRGKDSGDDNGNRRLAHQDYAAAAAQPSLSDIMTKLVAMDTRMATIETKLDSKLDLFRQEVSATCEAIREDILELKGEVASLKSENEALKAENQQLHSSLQGVQGLQMKVDDIENRSRRNNLLFYGIPRAENESSQDCEKHLQQFLKDSLQVQEPVPFDRVHRMSDKPDSPIIARCTFYKDRGDILRAKGKLKGTRVFVGEDFSQRVRSIRKALTPYLKEAKQAGKRAVMVFDHLLVDGKKYIMNEDNSAIVEVRQRVGR